MKDDWTLVYGLDVTGAASNEEDLLRAQGGDACRTSSFRPCGRFCPDVSVPATFTHSLSLSRDVAERFRITLGVANLFDTPPPRVSTVRSEEHTSELQSLMRISYAVFCLKQKKNTQ